MLCHLVHNALFTYVSFPPTVVDFISVAKYITDVLHICDISWVHLELDLGAINLPLSLLLKIVHKNISDKGCISNMEILKTI